MARHMGGEGVHSKSLIHGSGMLVSVSRSLLATGLVVEPTIPLNDYRRPVRVNGLPAPDIPAGCPVLAIPLSLTRPS